MSGSGLYIHVPFCLHKCGYCDFNSWAETGVSFQKEWLAGIERQIRFWSGRCQGKSFDTVFWGGGTPSLLNDKIFSSAMDLIFEHFQIESGAEISVECNPETLDAAKLQNLWTAGVNRISVGIQSFDDIYLKRLERKTSRESNLAVLDLVSKNWKGRWSLDLMFALPEQSLEHWLGELDLALTFDPSHISAYQLTLSTSRSKNWKQAPEDELLEFFVLTEERLSEAGLGRYEISNFARHGYECRHNLHYWNLDPFLALGPGACGLLPTSWVGKQNHSYEQVGFHQRVAPRWEHWLEFAGTEAEVTKWVEPRSSEDHLKELLLMNLRLANGFSLERWGAHQNQALQVFEVLKAKGLVENDYLKPQIWRATSRGAQILDTTIQLAYGLFDFDKIKSEKNYTDPVFV